MKNYRWTLVAALLLAVPTVSQAQVGPVGPPPGVVMGPPGSAAPAGQFAAPGGAATGSATADNGSITNTGVDSTTTTITSSPGIGPDGLMISEETTGLANTGGEPWMMSFLGLSMVAGAFMLRRRVSN